MLIVSVPPSLTQSDGGHAIPHPTTTRLNTAGSAPVVAARASAPAGPCEDGARVVAFIAVQNTSPSPGHRDWRPLESWYAAASEPGSVTSRYRGDAARLSTPEPQTPSGYCRPCGSISASPTVSICGDDVAWPNAIGLETSSNNSGIHPSRICPRSPSSLPSISTPCSMLGITVA